MFFLRLLTNKDVIHINFHSPQALPTLHLLLADFVGTSDLRQEWQTRRLFCALPEAAWQGRGLQSTASPVLGRMCLRGGDTGWFMKGNYSVWCRGLPTWTQVSVGWEKEWVWFYFWQRAASPCLLPETTCGRSEGALFCPRHVYLALLGICILWESYLLVDVDIGII